MLKDMAEWLGPVLSPADRDVLGFIIRRTLMMEREEWVITVEEIRLGIAIDGVLKVRGTGLGKATIHRSLNLLEANHIITRGKRGTGIYKVNVLAVDEDEFDNLVERSRRMGRRKGTDVRGLKLTLPESQNEKHGVSKRIVPRGRQDEGKTNEGTVATATVRSRVNNFKENDRKAKDQRVKVASRFTMTAVNEIREVVCRRHSVKLIAPLTARDFGILKRNYKAVPMRVETLLDWLIPDWNGIAGRHFETWPNYPTVPSMSFIAKSWRRMVKAYREDSDDLDYHNKRDAAKADDERTLRLTAEEEKTRLEKELKATQKRNRELNTRLGEDDIATSELRRKQQAKYRNRI